MPGRKATPTTHRKKTAKKASSPIKAAPRGSSVTLREDPLLYGAKQPRFIDLFCGIGGFRIAFEKQGAKCVFSSDYDKFSQQSYEANYGEKPHGDIHSVAVADIPAHDTLCGGFPCQPFSIAGVSKKNSLGRAHGFDDVKQGNLFFAIADIIAHHRPAAFVLENVKNLQSHDQGNTFRVIYETLTKHLKYTFTSYLWSSPSSS
jgi:DNA (cytosine-5)-methyltransferase 1